MRIDVFTLFPALVDGFCSESLLGKSRAAGLIDLRLHDPREHTSDVHRTVDDAPFGAMIGLRCHHSTGGVITESGTGVCWAGN